jgi:hypothetical protein
MLTPMNRAGGPPADPGPRMLDDPLTEKAEFPAR